MNKRINRGKPSSYPESATGYRHTGTAGKTLQPKHYGRILGGFLAAVLLIIVLSMTMIKTVSSATVRQPSVKCYRSVEIEKGDSLWSIAKQYYTDDWKDLDSYIDEIRQFNGLSNDYIRAGCYLAIPYYD